jgi:hypothetical protein
MRRILATLLLTLQFQPLWGLALCLSVAAPARPANEHCAGTELPVPATGAPMLEAGSAATGHGCPLAEVCTPSVLVALTPAPSARTVDLSSGTTLTTVDVPRVLARGAPPTPPPNL